MREKIQVRMLSTDPHTKELSEILPPPPNTHIGRSQIGEPALGGSAKLPGIYDVKARILRSSQSDQKAKERQGTDSCTRGLFKIL